MEDTTGEEIIEDFPWLDSVLILAYIPSFNIQNKARKTGFCTKILISHRTKMRSKGIK